MTEPAAQKEEFPTKRVESYLLKQTGVLEAQVWVTRGAVVGRAILVEDAECSEIDLIQACVKRFGKSNAPRMILLEKIKKTKSRRSA